jgi:hypothetical protein
MFLQAPSLFCNTYLHGRGGIHDKLNCKPSLHLFHSLFHCLEIARQHTRKGVKINCTLAHKIRVLDHHAKNLHLKQITDCLGPAIAELLHKDWLSNFSCSSKLAALPPMNTYHISCILSVFIPTKSLQMLSRMLSRIKRHSATLFHWLVWPKSFVNYWPINWVIISSIVVARRCQFIDEASWRGEGAGREAACFDAA